MTSTLRGAVRDFQDAFSGIGVQFCSWRHIISLIPSLYTYAQDFCLILYHNPKAISRQYKSVFHMKNSVADPAWVDPALGPCQPGSATSSDNLKHIVAVSRVIYYYSRTLVKDHLD